MEITTNGQTRFRLSYLFLVLLSLFAGFAFTYSPGTGDTNDWHTWIDNAKTDGLVRGYAENMNNYPPLASTILFLSNKILQPLHVDNILSTKISILFFLLLTASLFWLWTRDLKVTIILYFALLLNSTALGYIDIYFAPSLVLSLWMLKERRWMWFSIFFTLSCLTKYQPLIIGPFLLIYILDIQDIRQLSQFDWKLFFQQIVLPAAIMIIIILVGFGLKPIWLSFTSAFNHPYLSGNALNLNWIITHFLHVFDPNQFGGLINGTASYIITDSMRITLIPRLLFLITYLFALVIFFRREKTFTNLLIYAALGYFCYFTFNTGVHENHLFLLVILAIALFWLDENWRLDAVILLLINDINLFLFYGVDGNGMPFNRVFAGIDIALPMAMLNVLFFIYLYGSVITGNRKIIRSTSESISPNLP